ncbi:hypothetical protein J6590_052785 [Homalodisca vitripennis]|nr:hypothetical protein J6590_052785 [Homalodisca vitripennis]
MHKAYCSPKICIESPVNTFAAGHYPDSPVTLAKTASHCPDSADTHNALLIRFACLVVRSCGNCRKLFKLVLDEVYLLSDTSVRPGNAGLLSRQCQRNN